ncbi:MAG TPA: GGDEF domain-containing protein [Marinagarivorans sp.]
MTANSRPLRSLSRLEFALAIMAVLSIGIVAVPDTWLQTSLQLHPSHYPATLFGDQTSHGNSKPSWLNSSEQRWQCTIHQGAQDPYCSMQLDVTDKGDNGLDLSRYRKMTIWADYQGDAKYLRLYLRNRHPNYYIPNLDLSTKYNAIEVPVADLSRGLQLNMSDFVVAGWWLVGGDIPLENAQPEFNDISIIEVQTGSRVRSGRHEIQLKKIEWTGPLIAPKTLYQAVIVAWSMVVFGILLYRLIIAQREIKRQASIQKELMAINAALSLETRRFEELAKTDCLTGLLNRVGIRDILYRSLVEWRTLHTPFSFIIIDLDNFKAINDTYGHAAGDEVLKDAAELMLKKVRPADALTRWGGEEFVLACPKCNLEQAAQIAEKLRSTLETHLRCRGQTVTASFGVSTMKATNLDKLFKKADNALYQAKKLGRNRVCTETAA